MIELLLHGRILSEFLNSVKGRTDGIIIATSCNKSITNQLGLLGMTMSNETHTHLNSFI